MRRIRIAGTGLALTLCAWLFGHRRALAVLVLAAILAIGGGVGIGFGWAHWRAEIRLAESLPPESEVKDIEVIGAIASLPQLSERGTRFEFDIEKILSEGFTVPSHIKGQYHRTPNSR